MSLRYSRIEDVIVKKISTSDTIKFYENGIIKYSVNPPAYTFVAMNTIQLGTYPSPPSTFLMYKASIELYMKAMNETELVNNYARSLNNTFLLDSCRH